MAKPLDVTCPRCLSPPGWACASRFNTWREKPHKERVGEADRGGIE